MKKEQVENRAGERRNAGSFAWLESKEAEKRVSPPPFEERGSVANHTHTAGKLRRKTGKEENKDWKRG